MKKFKLKKSKNNVENDIPALSLPAVDGTPAVEFHNEVVENLRQMITRLNTKGELPSKLALVSALRGEGVTFISQALATTIAYDYSFRVCLVDLNWWWPSSFALSAPDRQGLESVLSGRAELDDVITPTGWSNLAFLPAGEMEREKRPVVARSQALMDVIQALETRYDHLIFDIPAVRATSDAIPLASLADACCFVVKQGITAVEDVRLALDDLNHLPILGVVMNQVGYSIPQSIAKLIETA